MQTCSGTRRWTTMIYVHVMNKPAVAVQSPLDRLGAGWAAEPRGDDGLVVV